MTRYFTFHPFALIFLTFRGTYLRQGYLWDVGDIGRPLTQTGDIRLQKEFRTSGNKTAERGRSVLLFERILTDYTARWSQLPIPVASYRLLGSKCSYGAGWGTHDSHKGLESVQILLLLLEALLQHLAPLPKHITQDTTLSVGGVDGT